MDGQFDDSVGIGGQRVPWRLWQREFVLRCAVFVAIIHGATLVVLGAVALPGEMPPTALPLRAERIIAGIALLFTALLILRRRRRWLMLSAATLHVVYTVHIQLHIACAFQRNYGIPLCLSLGPHWVISGHVWGASGFVGILLPVFIGLSVLGRSAKEAFSSSLRGVPLVPLASLLQVTSAPAAWPSIAAVLLSVVYVAQLVWI